jgi:FkbM family methyltransferase
MKIPASRFGRIRVLLRRWLRRKPRFDSGSAVQLAINEILGGRRNVFFVQIGTNDGEQGDPLRPFLLAKPGWRGVFVEPVGFLFAHVKALYADETDRFGFENVAIGTADGHQNFYYVSALAQTEAEPKVPHWCFQLGSFRKVVLAKNLGDELLQRLEPYIVEQDVETLTLDTLFHRNGVRQLDLLHIDAEGYDYKIVSQLDFAAYHPDIIVFESMHLTDDERGQAAELLNSNGYLCLEYGRDMIAVA